MKSIFFLISLFFFIAAAAQPKTAAEINKEVTAKVKQMTLDEKVGQMAQVAIDVIGKADYAKSDFTVDPAKLNDVVVNYKVGSILNSPGVLLSAQKWNEILAAIQGDAQKTRMKIPVIYGLDDIHGVNYVANSTLFPQEVGMAATWNRDAVMKEAVISAYESRAAGVPWTFSPVLDLGVDPQWPRIWEGFGEDPFLSSELGTGRSENCDGELCTDQWNSYTYQ
jgi:beta-glucosidase